MRVGAIKQIENGVVEFLGYGELLGEEIPPKEIGGFNIGRPNPKIQLDTGEVVWGCECWWATEDIIERVLKKNKEVVNVTIENLRAG